MCDPHYVKMQYGVNKQSQIFEFLSLSDRRFTEFVIKTEQVVYQSGIHITKNVDVISKYVEFFISNFRRVLYVVCFLLGDSPASKVYKPTFRNTLSVPSS
jgi:hypothetical protein